MDAKTFKNETNKFANFIYTEYDAVQRELRELDANYNDEKDYYIVTAKRFPPEARVLAKKYKRLARILDTLQELNELYAQS